MTGGEVWRCALTIRDCAAGVRRWEEGCVVFVKGGRASLRRNMVILIDVRS